MGIEQLRELLERLQADASQVTNQELSAAKAFIREQRGHLAGQDVSDEVIAALEELRDSFAAIKTVQDERATAAAELDERRRGLLSEIEEAEPEATTTEPPPGEGDDGEPAEGEVPIAEPTATEPPPGEPAAAETTDGTPETQPLAASARPPARRAPIGAFRTLAAARPPQDERLVARTVVTAAGGSPGFTQGQAIDSTAELAKAFAEKIRAMTTGKAGGGDKVYVANAVTSYPETRLLRAADWVGNFTKMEQATSPQALTAAGGICQPLQPLYDVEVIGSSARPVRDALAPFGVDRGGIQFRPPTSAATVLADAVGTWTSEQDADDSGDTKSCYAVVCPGVEEAMVQAIYLCLEFSNISARFDPESTAANVRQGLITHARKAENELLRLIQNESKVLSAPKVIGATRDLLANIDKASAYYRNRHRIDTEITMTCILPAWVRYMIRTDIARQMAAGDWMQALGVADSLIEQWFRNRHVNPAWHLDGGIGGANEVQTITITGAPTGGSYTLTFDGETTAAIAWNATAADVKDALDDLPGINFSDITTAGGPHPATAITVAFGGQYEMTNVPQMTATGSLTGGTTPAVAVTTTTASGTTSTVNGVSIASQVYGNAAAGAAIPGYPDQVDALLFPTGSILFLDGGTLDLGLVRDSTLNSRNRYRQFSETFEGIANRAVEPLRLAMTVQPTGQTAGTADTSAIAD
jgi:hypothetical protein